MGDCTMESSAPQAARTLSLDVRTSIDTALWDDALRRLGSNVFHSHEWALFTAAAQPNAAPYYFSLSDSSGVLGAALGFVSVSRFKVLRRLWFDALPAVTGSSEELISAFMAKVEDWARANRIDICTFGSYGYTAGLESLTKRAYALEKRFEFAIPLANRDIEEIWHRLNKDRRKNVRVARETGLTVEESTNEEGLKTLRLLHAQSSERIVLKGGPAIARFFEPGKDPFLALMNQGIGRIFIARLGDEPLSAILVSSYHGFIYGIAGGHSPEGFSRNSGTLLHWDLIEKFKAEGAHEYSIGGIKHEALDEKSAEHGVYIYKRQFGGETRECANGTKPVRTLPYLLVKPFGRFLD